MTVIPYFRTVTFGRFNIPHDGHVELVRKMLRHGERALVFLSSAKTNNDIDTRILMFRHLLRRANVDLERVELVKSQNAFAALETATKFAPFSEVALVLGEDQRKMGERLVEDFDCPLILNERTNSSTQIRFFLDNPDLEDDLERIFDGDRFSVSLAKVLRKEEISRDTLITSGKTS